MACTIDHLRVDHRVTVLRAFTDLAGHTVDAGETGVIRGLGVDYATMGFWIELDSDGKRRRLRFALRAGEGPGVGRMKDYFEVGDDLGPRRPAPPTPPPSILPAALGPRRPAQSLLPHVGTQPPDHTSLGELRVACDCDPAFHRDLLPAHSNLGVSGCLRCGTVTCTRTFGDDGRFTGEAWHENQTVRLPDAVHRWIAGWPRVRIDHTARSRWPMSADLVRYPTLFYPADTRCGDRKALQELETRLSREQSGQSSAACLRATHRVRSAPPSGIPEDLRGYRMAWDALRLQPDSPLAELLHLAQPLSPGRDLAVEWLLQRPDAFELTVGALTHPEETRQGIGYLLARGMHPVNPRLPAVLIELLSRLSFERLPDVPMGIVSRRQAERILLVLAERKLGTPDVLATLRALQRKLARHDDFLTNCVRIVLAELTSSLPTPPAPDAPPPTAR